MGEWHWSDVDRDLGRWSLFSRSAEFLTTAVLIVCALIFLVPGSTVERLSAFAWAFALTGANDFPWAVASFTLAFVAPLAVIFDDGRLRLLSLLGQGGFFIFLGVSASLNARNGLLWAIFLLCGCWLAQRSLTFAWPRLLANYHQLRQLVERHRGV